MKTEISFSIRVLIIRSSLRSLGYRLMKQGKYFIFFPYYWELIPVKLEKAIAHKNIGMRSHKKDDI